MPAGKAETVTTLDQLRALPDDGLRHELLDGVHVVTPSPRPAHQEVLLELIAWFQTGISELDHLCLYVSPADVQLGDRTLVQPDLFVVRRPASPPPYAWHDFGIPVLAVEILSPTTASRDRGVKRETYQAAAIAEYWIVDVDARLIERWRPEDDRPEVARAVLRWTPHGTDLHHEMDVASLFRRVFRDAEDA